MKRVNRMRFTLFHFKLFGKIVKFKYQPNFELAFRHLNLNFMYLACKSFITMQQQSNILLELHYFPSIQYFSKLTTYDKTYIEQHENYLKGSYRNRCHIVGANGLQRLSIPLKRGKNEQTPIKEVQISYAENWRTQHWMSIRSAYGRAPYFEHFADEIAPFFQKKPTFLYDFNWELLLLLVDLIQLEVDILPTASYEKQVAHGIVDFRNGIFPKKHRQKEDTQFKSVAYPQVFEERHGFLSNLSILDLLFCTGPQASLILEQCTR